MSRRSPPCLCHAYGLLDKKCIHHRVAGEIEIELKRVDVFVEPVRDDLVGAREGELRTELAEPLLRRDPEGAGQWLDTLVGPKREIAEAARQAITRTKHSHKEEAGR